MTETAEATITIVVPVNAVVLFNGSRTTQTGTERVFTTPALEKGMKFHYNVLASWNVKGMAVERTRRVPVTAGARVRVSFVEDEKPAVAKGKDAEKDKQIVTSKSTKPRTGRDHQLQEGVQPAVGFTGHAGLAHRYGTAFA